jgi:SAM-dependent methyltransferase
MVRQARQAVAGFPGAHVIRNNGKDLSAVAPHWWGRFGIGRRLEFDFAFSVIVFQHIPSREIIENYVREVHRMLRPGGLFKFQVQGSPVEVGSEPEMSWIGEWFTRQQAREMAERCGFELRYEYGAGDQYYWLWYFKR